MESSPASMSGITATLKKLAVHAPHAGITFSLALFPGTSDNSLREGVVSRLGIPLKYPDGSDSFYVTDGRPSGTVIPLCADALPADMFVAVHLNARPDDPERPPSGVSSSDHAAPTAAPGSPAVLAMAPTTALATTPAAAPAAAPAISIVSPKAVSSPLRRQPTLRKITPVYAATRLQASMRGKAARRKMAHILCEKGTHGLLNRCCHLPDECLSLANRLKLTRWLPGYMNKYDRVQGKPPGDEVVYGMAKMSRLSTVCTAIVALAPAATCPSTSHLYHLTGAPNSLTSPSCGLVPL